MSMVMSLSWCLMFQVHENAYLSDFHHCFSLPSNSSGKSVEDIRLVIVLSS